MISLISAFDEIAPEFKFQNKLIFNYEEERYTSLFGAWLCCGDAFDSDDKCGSGQKNGEPYWVGTFYSYLFGDELQG